jgi:ketosteroid isomerase-like protein
VTDDAPASSELRRLNIELTEQERRGVDAVAWFEGVLDDRLVFRRGNGTVVDKDGFLEGLKDPGNTNEVLTTEIRQVQMLGDQAFVEAEVRLKGTRGGKPVDGTFRNLRLFERQADGWRCVMWFNKPTAIS